MGTKPLHFVNAAIYPSTNRLDRWYEGLDRKIEYFQARKDWARNLMKKANLTSPGDSLEGVFAEINHEIKIGPRGGIRIRELPD